jgi:hypothetical protein
MIKRKLSQVATACLLMGGVVFAQEPPPGPPPGPDAIMPGGPMGGRMEILGFSEMHPGKVVAGAPYSAVAVSETVQTLGDGTVIDRKIQSNVYRDGQGRTRRETTLPAVGPLATSGQNKSIVAINDPIASKSFVLHPDQKVAMLLPAHGRGNKGGTAAAGAGAIVESRIQAREQAEIASGRLKKDDLGTQSINGINAQGTRFTRSIAAGEIGNDKIITITSERWYSPDLQIVVKSVRTDPRFGQTTYTLTNIQRTEPAATLFAVPADYTVQQGGPGGRGRRGPGGPGAPGAVPMDGAPPAGE